MTDVERIRAICKQKGIKIAKLERDLSYGNGYLNPKKISTVSSDRLLEIANYLDVAVEMLLGEKDAERSGRIEGAFWGGDDPDLTPEERSELWDDMKDYYEYKKKQLKERKKGK